MAEFCLECYNKYFSDKEVSEKDVIMDIDLCEECGEWKPCVIRIKEKNIFKIAKNKIKVFLNKIILYCFK